MGQGQPGGAKEERRVAGKGGRAAVQLVACEGMACVGHVGADLVAPAGAHLHLDHGVVLELSNGFEFGGGGKLPVPGPKKPS